MAESTNIEWATHTWSPWRGCQHAELPDGTPHPGCLHCYAETMSKRNTRIMGEWGKDGTRVISAPRSWEQVRKWNDHALATRQWHSMYRSFDAARPRIFPSVCDPFEDWAGEVQDHFGNAHYTKDTEPFDFVTNEQMRGCDSEGYHYTTLWDVRLRLLDLIQETEHLDWTLLTKRPWNVRSMMSHAGYNDKLDNAWLIYSASDQASLEAGIADVLRCRDLFPVIGGCLGPLVGPVDLSKYLDRVPRCGECAVPLKRVPNSSIESYFPCHLHDDHGQLAPAPTGLDWVIIEGESGGGARPCNPEWVRSIVQQCKFARVPVFVKQFGANVVTRNDMVEDVFSSSETGWPDPDVEYDIHGYREDYQGADCRIRLRDKKGGNPEEWPEDLRVREFPQTANK